LNRSFSLFRLVRIPCGLRPRQLIDSHTRFTPFSDKAYFSVHGLHRQTHTSCQIFIHNPTSSLLSFLSPTPSKGEWNLFRACRKYQRNPFRYSPPPLPSEPLSPQALRRKVL
jgi:hypothetical protein